MFKKYRWVIIFMLFLGGMINYMDRAAFSIAAPFITQEYGVSATQMGLIFSSFSIGYTLFNFVGGYLADRYGPRKTFGYAMLLWSTFCGLTAVAFSFASLFAIRLLFGIGEGPLGSTTNKAVSNWVPARARARAVGFAFSGNPLGGALAGPIVGAVALLWHWKASFVVLAAIGFIWALFWMRMVTDEPAQHPKASAEEVSEMAEDAQRKEIAIDGKKPSMMYFIRQPSILCTALAFFGYNYILYFFLTWFPSYLSMARGLSIKDMSLATSIPWIVGAVGLMISGVLSDYLYRRTGRLLHARKTVLVWGLVLSAICIGVTGWVTTTFSAVLLMTCGIFFMYITSTSYWSIISDSVSKEYVGAVTGFVHAAANLSGIVAPILTGLIIEHTGKFDSAFYTAGGLALIGALSVIVFVKPLVAKGAMTKPGEEQGAALYPRGADRS